MNNSILSHAKATLGSLKPARRRRMARNGTRSVKGAFGGKKANAPRINDWITSATQANELAQKRRLAALGME